MNKTEAPSNPLNDPAAPNVVCIPYTLIACENAQEELLMLKRTKPPFVGMWNFLGGKIELGELPHISACRELGEEIGQTVKVSLLEYRGVAIWHDADHAAPTLTGMHLFHVRLTAKLNSSRQLALLDEGVTAWLPKALLCTGGDFPPVPNFDVLYPILLGKQSAGPAAIVHWLDGSNRYDASSYPLRTRYRDPGGFPPGHVCMEIDEFAEVQ